jgi:hypothetical protein
MNRLRWIGRRIYAIVFMPDFVMGRADFPDYWLENR